MAATSNPRVSESSRSKQVAFYGGSFNPPHIAHVLAVAYLLAAEPLERVMVVPVFQHAFDKQLAPFDDRVRMCELALGWLPHVEVSRIEEKLPAPNYTLSTLQRLAVEHPDWRLRLVVGSDVLFEAHKWHAFDEVKRLAPPLILGRVGFDHPEAPLSVLPDVSSTHIRGLLAQDPAHPQLRHSLPLAARNYIADRGLYR